MKYSALRATGVVAVVAAALAGPSLAMAEPATTLRVPEEFRGIDGDQARSVALFNEMSKVITHPRCMNCHPREASPRQGDDLAMHQPPVIRYNESGMGAPGMQCSACHGAENVTLVGVGGIKSMPGHEPWHLAPKSMGWIGLSVGEICEQLKDPERNGDRDLAAIHDHMANDGLVGWGWEPGEGRTPAPGSQRRFGRLTKAWIDTGAHCPDT